MTDEIVVVDTIKKPWPRGLDAVKQLTANGVPLKTAMEWLGIRKHMSPQGLRKWARENRN